MAQQRSNRRHWLFWGLLTLLLAAYFGIGLAWSGAAHHAFWQPARAALVPGPSTHGHHQIELACESCHTAPFGAGTLMQQACTGCHGKAMDEANDKHPARKFNDPRNLFRLEKIDATACVTCHVEHRPRVTKAMGLTQPLDMCAHCHSGKDEMPPSHAELPFNGCLASGCHNYHDNRALYEDFLLKHAHAPALLDKRTVPARGLLEALQQRMAYPMDKYPFERVAADKADAPASWKTLRQAGAAAPGHADALDTGHARAGVNCSGCHQVGANLPAGATAPPDAGQWVQRPATPQACVGCHAEEVKGFGSGLHGMRSAAGLAPMTPALARLPMKPDAGHQALTCTSCHGAHAFETTTKASVDACLACHDDSHSRAYRQSRHFQLVQQEQRGELPAGSGVTCATCHMPRMRIEGEEGSRPGVQHNQSLTLQPNSKMVRPVCQSCHGLGFALDALADRALITRNFQGQPSVHVTSIEMALRKDAADKAARAAADGAAAKNPP